MSTEILTVDITIPGGTPYNEPRVGHTVADVTTLTRGTRGELPVGTVAVGTVVESFNNALQPGAEVGIPGRAPVTCTRV